MILKAGTFRVRDYRKPIPARVKQAVIAREFDFDHDPALVRRDYDTGAGDFIPPQNDPRHIIARRKAEHLEKTIGRKQGAERTVSTRGSDVGEAAAIGAAAGAIIARRRTKEAQAQATHDLEQQSQQAAQATQQQMDNFKKAFSVCLEGKEYLVKY